MYRPSIYQQQHQKQLEILSQSDQYWSLTISPANNSLYYLTTLASRGHQTLITQLSRKEQPTLNQLLYLTVALKLNNTSYHAILSQLKKKDATKGNKRDITEIVDKLTEYFSSLPPLPVPKQTKSSVRHHYQLLLGKANSENYFKLNQMPVFLLSTKWLQRFYSSGDAHPKSISNQSLVTLMPYVSNNPQQTHYNLKIREDIRQNQDFKLIPYQAWNFLYQIYGGLQIKRFTTKQEEPIVQIWYPTVTILIVEQRCLLHRIQMQVSKNDTFQHLCNRLKSLLQSYKVIPQNYLKRVMNVYRSKQLSIEQVTKIIQDDEHEHIHSSKFQKIDNPSTEFEQAGIYSLHDMLIVNLVGFTGDHGIFSKLAPIKLIQKEKCLKCGSTELLTLCKCKSVHFCSKQCRDSHTQHLKDCNTIVSQTRKLNAVLDFYDTKKKNHSNFTKFIQSGRVGFENLGNTCYMNAALQCVLRLIPLSQYFMGNQHIAHLNVGNVLGSEGHLACAYAQLVKSFYTTGKRALEPSAVLRVIAKNPQFRGYAHQDSQQFLNYFLDKLHEDLNTIRVKPYIEDIESGGRPDEVVSQLSWQAYLKRNCSFVSQLLAGQYRSEIRCPDCQRISITFDPFMSVTLQFPKPQKGIEFQGFFLTDEGDFQKVVINVNSSMISQQFFLKYFTSNVHAVYQVERKVVAVWNKSKTVFANKRESGTLFFYEREKGNDIQISIEFATKDSNKLLSFTRLLFLKQVENEDTLKREILKIVKMPVLKSLSKQLMEEQYLQFCNKNQILTFLDQPTFNYPIKGAIELTVRVQIKLDHLNPPNPLKLSVSSKKYTGKQVTLVKKMGNSLKINELLSTFSQPQKLTQDNAWYCSQCKSHKLADKKMSLYKMPQCLIIHLKRFNHRGDSGNRYIIYGEKVNTPILLQEFQEINGLKYQLVGMVNHVGSLMHGHYTAVVKRDEWMNYDDSRCSRGTLDGKNAYLLFYQRVNQ